MNNEQKVFVGECLRTAFNSNADAMIENLGRIEQIERTITFTTDVIRLAQAKKTLLEFVNGVKDQLKDADFAIDNVKTFAEEGFLEEKDVVKLSNFRETEGYIDVKTRIDELTEQYLKSSIAPSSEAPNPAQDTTKK